MSGSKDQTAAAWGALLPAAATAHPPRVAIWHGDADYVVRTSNATQLVRQWTSAHKIAESAKQSEKVGPAEHTTYRDGSGNVVVESWIIGGMGHGVALDPKNHCGTAGAFLLDVALCSTERAASFFFSTTSGSAAVPATGTTAQTCE
jgi:poly(3-hydroxybutyrate) depolymerase